MMHTVTSEKGPIDVMTVGEKPLCPSTKASYMTMGGIGMGDMRESGNRRNARGALRRPLQDKLADFGINCHYVEAGQ